MIYKFIIACVIFFTKIGLVDDYITRNFYCIKTIEYTTTFLNNDDCSILVKNTIKKVSNFKYSIRDIDVAKYLLKYKNLIKKFDAKNLIFIAVNSEINKNEPAINSLILNQSKLNNYQFGFNTIDNNGCSIIAIHNSLILAGNESNFNYILSYFNNLEYLYLFGFLGVDPYYISAFLEDNKIPTILYLDKECFIKNASSMSINQSFILGYWNNKNIFYGAHYVSGKIIYKSNQRYYRIYNYYENSEDYIDLISLEEILSEKEYILSYIIKCKS